MGRTVASNAAGIRVELFHFLKCDGKDLIVLGIALLVGGVVAGSHLQAGLIILGIGAFVVWSSAFSVPQIFREGDVCPAVVLDPDRQLIAVLTDLSKSGRGGKPVIKVLRQPLRRAVKKPMKKGTRLAFVAMYNGSPGSKNWANFGGYLADVGTRSSKAIQRVVASIPEPDWQSLLTAVERLKQPYSSGLYDVEQKRSSGEGSHWQLIQRPGPLRIRPQFAIGAVAFLVVIGFLVRRIHLVADTMNPLPARMAATPADPVDIPERIEWPPAPAPEPAPSPPTADFDPTQIARKLRTVPTDAAASPIVEPDPVRRPPAGVPDFRPGPPVSSDPNREWRVGEKAEAFWGSRWYVVTILAVHDNGLKVHWDGWSDSFDEVLPRDRLRPIAADK
jgi:hypothetical protein